MIVERQKARKNMAREMSRTEAAAIIAGACNVTRSMWGNPGRGWVCVGKNHGIMGWNWSVYMKDGAVHVSGVRNWPRMPLDAEWVEDPREL